MHIRISKTIAIMTICLSYCGYSNAIEQQNKTEKLRIKQVIPTIDFQFTDSGIQVDTKQIDQDVKTWLIKSGLKLYDSNRSQASETYNLHIKVAGHRSEDNIYWHAISAECYPLNSTETHDNNSPTISQQNKSLLTAAHILGQNGEIDFYNNIIKTLKRVISETTGVSEVQTGSHPLDAFGTAPGVKRGGNFTSVLPNGSIEDLRVNNYSFEPLKIIRQPPPPNYPQIAKSKGIQGTVVVGVIVNKTGKPIIVEALSGPNELLECAIRYALSWEFEPGTINGNPKSTSFKLTLPFRLN